MQLSDAEVMGAAEAVVYAYLQRRLGIGPCNASAARTTKIPSTTAAPSSSSSSSQKPCSCETLRREAQSLYILSCVVEMVRSGLTCTERDVYYRNAPLFTSQSSVHVGIARLCRWMSAASPLPPGGEPRGYTREGLRIGTSGRSLLAGRMVLDVSSETIDARAHSGGVLVSTALALRGQQHRGGAEALVLVEKESTLRALLDAGAGDRVALLCTKGYPCAASRLLLRAIHRALPKLPLVALVDGDPHGMRIALTLALSGGSPIGVPNVSSAIGAPNVSSAIGAPNVSSAIGAISAISACSAIGVSAPPLPLRWIGVRPSALPLGARGRARLTDGDRRVLAQVRRRAAAAAARLSDGDTVLRASLEDMSREAQWMEAADIKCALQAWPEGPLHILHEAQI